MYHIGQKVVCIKDEFREDQRRSAWFHGIEFPKKDEVYTIRGAVSSLYGRLGPYYLLEEIKNPAVPLKNMGARDEPHFGHTRFRPLITVEDFMGTNVREKEPA
jgi:hypothetical protein